MAEDELWVPRREREGLLDNDGGGSARSAKAAPPKPGPPASLTVTSISNANTYVAPVTETNDVVSPDLHKSPSASFRFAQVPSLGSMSNLLFRVDKGGRPFWVGVAVPFGTKDFTRAHVYFHPTVKQGKEVRAEESDYPTFTGGWVTTMQRYTKIAGGQLAASGATVPLIVPFTTMGSHDAKPKTMDFTNNMFNSRPAALLSAVLGAAQDVMTGTTGNAPELKSIGVSSFSSGIHAMKIFLAKIGGTKLVAEINDFDGPFIKGPTTKVMPRLPGAVSRTFTQEFSTPPQAGWITVTKEHFELISAHSIYPEPQRTHARIGWMMYHPAMNTSAVR